MLDHDATIDVRVHLLNAISALAQFAVLDGVAKTAAEKSKNYAIDSLDKASALLGFRLVPLYQAPAEPDEDIVMRG